MKTMNLTLMLLLFAASAFAQNVPAYVPTNGLVGWWPFNGNANDESGNGNNGTVNGATLTSDRFGNAGKAYDFDGVDDYILVNNLNISNSWSIGFWFESTDTNLFTQQYLIGNGNNNYSCGIAISGNNSPAISGKSIFSYDGFTPLQNIVDGGLYGNLFDYHVVVVSQGGVQSIYVNSNLINSNQLDQIIINSCAFGKRLDNLFYFLGKLDDIGIWNRALTQQEITNLYNGGICYQTITVTDTLLINTGITGFNPVTYENTIRIWPNPTYDHITIDAGDLNVMNGYSIRIVNALGQQVFQTALTQQQYYLDLSTWTGSGIYYVNIINPQGVTIDTRKIVLQ